MGNLILIFQINLQLMKKQNGTSVNSSNGFSSSRFKQVSTRKVLRKKTKSTHIQLSSELKRLEI